MKNLVEKYKLLKDLSKKLSWFIFEKGVEDEIVKAGAIFDLHVVPAQKDHIYMHAHKWNKKLSFQENVNNGYMLITARLSEIKKHPDFFKPL